jgi:hypothetical protein
MAPDRRKTDGIGYKVMFGLSIGAIGTLFSLVVMLALGRTAAIEDRVNRQEITAVDIKTAQGVIITEIKNLAKGQDELKESMKEIRDDFKVHVGGGAR